MIEIEEIFDSHLFQIEKGVSHEQLDKGIRCQTFNNFKEWKSKYGYKFHIYNDHLINGQRHFHFFNKDGSVHCKIDFTGSILESVSGKIPKNIHNELIYFLNKPNILGTLNSYWNKMNP